jgi:15-cis-phytoene synthase
VAVSIEQSFDYCRRLTRREAKNFYFSFLTLPKEKQNAMCSIYTWMRKLDDYADDAPSLDDARKAVESWKRRTHQALDKGDFSDEDMIWPSFAETVKRYSIPLKYFDEIVLGALMDQEKQRYETFEELYQYCYRVASVVGLVSLCVFEYKDKSTEQHGEWLGIAFQLTNILRDVSEDAQRDRIYIPREELKKFGIAEDQVLKNQWSAEMYDLLKFFGERAETYYQKAQPVIGQVSKDSRPTLAIMEEIYHGVLKEIQKKDYRVFDNRARVPTWKKLLIVAKHFIKKS